MGERQDYFTSYIMLTLQLTHPISSMPCNLTPSPILGSEAILSCHSPFPFTTSCPLHVIHWQAFFMDRMVKVKGKVKERSNKDKEEQDQELGRLFARESARLSSVHHPSHAIVPCSMWVIRAGGMACNSCSLSSFHYLPSLYLFHLFPFLRYHPLSLSHALHW